MEPIITLVGFLGVGKTTLLKRLTSSSLELKLKPYIILNDYENAQLDAQDFLQQLNQDQVSALSGSCICCSGISDLRGMVNGIPKRDGGVTLIEANGTTDAVSLMGFLGLGMKEYFLPPVQIGVVDARNWQKRDEYNDLELNQVMASSVIVINFEKEVSIERLVQVEQDLRQVNKKAKIVHWNQLELKELLNLEPVTNSISKMEHTKSHWASCSVDFPDPISEERLDRIIKEIPSNILRVKGVTRINSETDYSYFEKTPDAKVYIRPYRGDLSFGAKILTIGPGSDPIFLTKIINQTT